MKTFTRILAILAALAFPLVSTAVAAAAATVTLSAPATVSQGETFTVSIYEDSGATQVNAASIHLTYPTSQLDYVGNGSSSAFPVVANDTGGGGDVTMDRGAITPVTGKQLIGTVRFTAKVSSGTAGISMAGDSHVVSGANEILSGGASTSVALQAAAPSGGGSSGTTSTPKTSSGGSSSKSTSPTKTTTPTPTAATGDTLPPAISNVAVTAVGTNTATITWTTSEAASSEVDYGTSTLYGLTAVDGTLTTSHSVTLTSPGIQAAVTYHFTVKSTDAAGNTAAGTDNTFTTRGVSVLVKVVDKQKKPVVGAVVTIGSATGTTDQTGQATLRDVSIGKQQATITYHGKKTNASVTIGNPDEQGQAPAVTLTAGAGGSPVWLVVILLLLVAAAVGAWIIRKRNDSDPFGGGFMGPGMSAPVVGGSPTPPTPPHGPAPIVVTPGAATMPPAPVQPVAQPLPVPQAVSPTIPASQGPAPNTVFKPDTTPKP